MKINSTTTTREEAFEFTLEVNEDNEILGATTFIYACSACGNEVESEGLTEDEGMFCEDRSGYRHGLRAR